jgi:hypothetical protein
MKAIALARVREIRQLHEEIGETLRTTLPKAIRIGRLLAEQKAETGHGEWAKWLKANVPFSERTAQDYMRFYARRAELKSAPGADIRGARALLAIASTKAKPAPVSVVEPVYHDTPAIPVVREPVAIRLRHELATTLRRWAEALDK